MTKHRNVKGNQIAHDAGCNYGSHTTQVGNIGWLNRLANITSRSHSKSGARIRFPQTPKAVFHFIVRHRIVSHHRFHRVLLWFCRLLEEKWVRLGFHKVQKRKPLSREILTTGQNATRLFLILGAARPPSVAGGLGDGRPSPSRVPVPCDTMLVGPDDDRRLLLKLRKLNVSTRDQVEGINVKMVKEVMHELTSSSLLRRAESVTAAATANTASPKPIAAPMLLQKLCGLVQGIFALAAAAVVVLLLFLLLLVM